MTLASPTDRFAIWRRRVHPALLVATAAFIVLLAGALLMPEQSRAGIPGDLVAQVVVPSIAALVVIIAGRSATFSVLAIRLPFFQAAAWILGSAAVLVSLAIAEMKLTGRSFYLVDFLMRTSAFPVWAVEQFAGATTFPFVEEVIFRGVIQTELKKRIGTIAAVLATSVLFGFAHVEGTKDYSRIALLCCAGLVFGIVRERTDSIGAPIAVHGIYNAVLALLEFVP
jgi:membrane protease YdiL (CAAX protease family)